MALYKFKGDFGVTPISWTAGSDNPPAFSGASLITADTLVSAYEIDLYGDTDGILSTTAINNSIIGPSTVSSSNPLKRVLIVGDALEIIAGRTGGNDSILAGSGVGRSEGSPFTFGNFVYGDALTIFSNAALSSSIALGGNDGIDGGDGLNGFEQLVGDAYLIQAKRAGTGPYTDNAKGGNDRIGGSNGTKFSNLYGDAVDMKDYGTGGKDEIWGGNGSVTNPIQRQIIVGDAYEMGGFTTGGNGKADVLGGDDVLVAGNGILSNRDSNQFNCYVVGDGFDMLTGARGGADVIYGGDSETNYLIGDGYTMAANTKTFADVLVGGIGNDFMWGDNVENIGRGPVFSSDRFVFGRFQGAGTVKVGADEVVDFDYSRKAAGDSLVFDGAFTDDLDGAGGLSAPSSQQTWQFLRDSLVSNSGDANFNFASKTFNGRSWSGSLYVFGLPASVFSDYTTFASFKLSRDASYVNFNTFDPTPPTNPFA